MSELAPIALFVYRRASHLRATLEALRANPEAAASDLWIFSDAPRDASVAPAVAQVRALIAGVTGFRSVRVIERSRNFGLAGSIVDGVTNLCAEYGRTIVLEDDLVTAPGFLGFINRGLDRYAHQDRVMQVSGFMFPVSVAAGHDSLFLPFPTSWGWGCWQRSWQHFIADIGQWQTLRGSAEMRHKLDLDGAYDYSGLLDAQAAGKVDSWAVRWHLSVMLRSGLVLYPRRSLVSNIGIDGSGTHGVGSPELQRAVADVVTTPRLPFPDVLEVDARTYSNVQAMLRSLQPGPLRRLLHRLRAWL